MIRSATIENGEAIALAALPDLPLGEFLDGAVDAVAGGQRIAALFAAPAADGSDDHELFLVLADAKEGLLRLARTRVAGRSFPSITPRCTQAHLFEREIHEQYGLVPLGHPWSKPVRFQPPLGVVGPGERPAIGHMDFYRVEGEEVHEVAVGPVHAGIIEPGHFRFQCHGEEVLHLEISLGYQHRGVERRLKGGPDSRTAHIVETLAGDTTIGHAVAYCHAVEALGGLHAPARAQFLRGIALELERLANHVGDLGALAGDVGFLPTASYCGRIRGDFLNLTAALCGNRFGRDFARPGGVLFDLDEVSRRELAERLVVAEEDTANAVELLWGSASVMSRFDGIGALEVGTAAEIGMVGPAARACGLSLDVRNDFPKGVYRYSLLPTCTWETGDVFARAYVRWLEIQNSLRFLGEELAELPAGPIAAPHGALRPNHIVASLCEGWRGEICHVILTGAEGEFRRYKVVDPSFHNWFGVALALRGQEISDFPLCNKSFNLSYAGFDL